MTSLAHLSILYCSWSWDSSGALIFAWNRIGTSYGQRYVNVRHVPHIALNWKLPQLDSHNQYQTRKKQGHCAVGVRRDVRVYGKRLARFSFSGSPQFDCIKSGEIFKQCRICRYFAGALAGRCAITTNSCNLLPGVEIAKCAVYLPISVSPPAQLVAYTQHQTGLECHSGFLLSREGEEPTHDPEGSSQSTRN